jgi:hypothetical protein
LGYGELLDSFPFLDRLMSTFIEHSKLNIFAEEFGKDLEQLDRLKLEAETNSSKEIELVSGRLIKKVIFVSRFMPRLSIQMQEKIKSVLDTKKIVHQELQTELLELPEVKELLHAFNTNQEKEEFFRNIFFPNTDGKQLDLELDVKCPQCDFGNGRRMSESVSANLKTFSDHAALLQGLPPPSRYPYVSRIRLVR